VSAPESPFEHLLVFGTSVIEAARLVTAADGGQILATALVRAVAGARTDARFRDLGLLQLKGIRWPPARLFGAGYQPSLAGAHARERAGLRRPGTRDGAASGSVEEDPGGERRGVFVGGEPGVGKTRVAAELARSVHADGAIVLAGRCDEDLGMFYQPFVEVLRYFAAHIPVPDLASRLGRHAGGAPHLRHPGRSSTGMWWHWICWVAAPAASATTTSRRL
jgi:hypothetical protein